MQWVSISGDEHTSLHLRETYGDVDSAKHAAASGNRREGMIAR
jgi:hypothetical protein